jgi:Zn-dependent M28 family amino/carboxypeptidase
VGPERFDQLVKAVDEPDFRPVPLDLTASLEATSMPGSVRTYNLIARLPGRRPSAGVVLLLAHWDHFGTCAEPPATDLICNGAVDNASGLAVLTELAKRLSAGPRMDRDVYFLATTGEEWGLLGAQAFAENPPVPLDSIVAAFNLDTVAVAPAGSPVAIVGKGLTPLEPGIAQVLAETHRTEGDEHLAQDYVRRQDGWALLQRDVPAVSVTSAFSQAAPLERYMTERYHQPSDEAHGIELGGAADDLVLTAALVRYFADPQRWPGKQGKSSAAP